MTFQGDPHRTLGVAPGASLNEIKSAYRRLVKKYHPDAAGERALPRFLAIQAAYERLVDAEGRLRAAPGPGRAGPAPSGPWRADPARARASRDAWRARRAWAAGAGTSTGTRARRGSTGTPGATGGPDPTTAPGGPAGSGGPGDRARPHREHHARRGPRKATPGSTTYDEAAEIPLDPEWDGGAWYGPSSGTYWTINPREYADPRKHGPEYQARARRAARAQRLGIAEEPGIIDAEGSPGAPGPSPSTEAAGDGPRWRWTGGDATATAGGAEWGTEGWWYDATSAGATGSAASQAGPGPATRAAAADPPRDLESVARRLTPPSLLALARHDVRWRITLVLAGWPPIAWAVGTLASQATACAPAAPDCAPVLGLLPPAAALLVAAGLYLAPPAAAAAAFASLVALGVALPAAAVLSLGGSTSDAPSPALGLATAVAYLTSLAFGITSVWRATDGTGQPPPGT